MNAPHVLGLVDGNNVVMRCAFGGAVEPGAAVPVATGMIQRWAREAGITHLIVALDGLDPEIRSWRATEVDAEYKATRTTDTSPYARAAEARWVGLGWCVEHAPGWEADDLIMTRTVRAADRPGTRVAILSGDSDLLAALDFGAEGAVTVWQPCGGGSFRPVAPADVIAKYGVPPGVLAEWKALTGEVGDNVKGVPGIGAKRATALLTRYGSLLAVIAAGDPANPDPGGEKPDRDARRVWEHRGAALRALALTTLRADAPVRALLPAQIAYPGEAEAEDPLAPPAQV